MFLRGIVKGIVNTFSGSCGILGGRIHLQRWVCGIVRGSYPCRMPLCGIVKGLRMFHPGITWEREGDRKFLLGSCGVLRGIVLICRGGCADACGDHTLVGCRCAGSSGDCECIVSPPSRDRAGARKRETEKSPHDRPQQSPLLLPAPQSKKSPNLIARPDLGRPSDNVWAIFPCYNSLQVW